MNKTYALLLSFAVALLAIFSFANQSYAASHAGMEDCVKNCHSCSAACDKALQMATDKTNKDLQSALSDCSQICKTSEGMISRGSQFHPQVCKVCAEVCAKCAELCEKSKDKELQNCAKECRKCEDSCKKMAS